MSRRSSSTILRRISISMPFAFKREHTLASMNSFREKSTLIFKRHRRKRILALFKTCCEQKFTMQQAQTSACQKPTWNRSLYLSNAREHSKSFIDATLSNLSCLQTLLGSTAFSIFDCFVTSLLLPWWGEDIPLSCVFSFGATSAPELYLLLCRNGGVELFILQVALSSCLSGYSFPHSLEFNSSIEGCDFRFCLFGVRNGLLLFRCKAGEEGAL